MAKEKEKRKYAPNFDGDEGIRFSRMHIPSMSDESKIKSEFDVGDEIALMSSSCPLSSKIVTRIYHDGTLGHIHKEGVRVHGYDWGNFHGGLIYPIELCNYKKITKEK